MDYTCLPSGVLQNDEFAVSRAFADGDGSLGAALVSGLSGHFSFDHLTNL